MTRLFIVQCTVRFGDRVHPAFSAFATHRKDKVVNHCCRPMVQLQEPTPIEIDQGLKPAVRYRLGLAPATLRIRRLSAVASS